MGYDRMGFEWLYLPKNATEAEKEAVNTRRDRSTKYFDVPREQRGSSAPLRRAAPVPKLVKHIFGDHVAPASRTARVGIPAWSKLGKHRIGDGGELVVLQFVGGEEGPEIGGRRSGRRATADRRTAYLGGPRVGQEGPDRQQLCYYRKARLPAGRYVHSEIGWANDPEDSPGPRNRFGKPVEVAD